MFTELELLAMMVVMGIGTVLTRAIPFLLLPESKETPKIVLYIGRLLPAASMGLLIVYCLKDVSFGSFPFGVPELISIIVVALLHKWKGNVLLSIFGGTGFYMFLVQFVFV